MQVMPQLRAPRKLNRGMNLKSNLNKNQTVMKKTLFISLSLLAGFTFTSCQKEPSQGSEQKPVTITINAVAGDEVTDGKAYLRGTTTMWNAGDAFDSRIKDGTAWKDQIFVSQNETAAAEAEFEGTLETSVTKGSIWAYFPANSKTTPSKVRKLLFDLSAQNFTKLSDFGKYSIMVAAKPDYIINNEVQGNLTFRQVTAAFNFRIANKASDAITLTKAVVSTENENDVFATKGEIWGTITYNDTDTEFADKTKLIAEPKNATNKLTLTYSGTQAEVVVLPNDGKAYASQLCFFPTTQTVADSFKGTKVTIKVYYTLNGVNRVLTKTGTLNQIITRATKVNIPLTIDGTDPESGQTTFDAAKWTFASGGTIPTWNEKGTTGPCTYSIVGFNGKNVPATEGTGKIQLWNSVDKIAEYEYVPSSSYPQVRLVATDGTPYSVGLIPNDYWYFEAEGTYYKGDVVTIKASTKSSNVSAHPANWRVEYSEDGGSTWTSTGSTYKYVTNGAALSVNGEFTLSKDASKIVYRFIALDTDWTKKPQATGVVRISSASATVTREL